ncbi:MAG: glyoxalase [Limnothrix sp. RL_2_0]|nr:glyoxalase [Limnothrix sp. RL_2_0]
MHYSEVFITIGAEPWREVVDFYTQLFLVTPQPLAENRYAEFQLGSLRLGIFKPSADHTEEFRGNSGSLSFCVEVENLEEAIAQVITAQGTVSPEIVEASHGRECYAYDPLKNRIILHETRT